MTVCSVIVTYSDRFSFLSEVINGLWKEKIDVVVIINNGASNSSTEQIFSLQKKYPSRIITYSYEKNQGTAVAFKKGIQIACESHCDYIWILDDDNKPENDSLQELKKFDNGTTNKKLI